jgi:hypothetical protein
LDVLEQESPATKADPAPAAPVRSDCDLDARSAGERALQEKNGTKSGEFFGVVADQRTVAERRAAPEVLAKD